MTALHKFERLEALGQWQAHKGAAHIEVIVQLGRHTLTVIRADGTPMAHWALGSVILEKIEGANAVQLYADAHSGETLRLTDADMIHALHLIEQSNMPRGKSKAPYIWGFIALLAVACAGWVMVQKIPTYVANHLPMTTQKALGAQMLAQFESTCTTPEGRSALHLLESRLAPLGHMKVHVLPLDVHHVITLPGEYYIVPQNVLLQSPSPDVLAGHMIEAATTQLMAPSVHMTTQSIGIWNNITLLVNGTLSPTALQTATTHIINTPHIPPPAQNLAQGFDITAVNAGPFAKVQKNDTLMARNTHPNAAPILPDGAFLALKHICD